MDITAQLQSKKAVTGINAALQGVTVALVLLTGYLAADFLLLFLNPPQAEVTAGRTVSSKSTASVDPANIPSWNIFGNSEEADAPAVPSQMDVPKTTLKLELLGVVAGQTEDDPVATAIIAEKGKDGDVYKIGDKVKGKAELKSIFQDRVILERKGKLETLAFDLAYKPKPTQPNRFGDRDRKDIKRAAEKIARPRGSMTSDIREILSRDASGMVSGLGLEAVNEGGSDGYKVTAGAPAALLSRVGLRRDDIILSVNGNPVGNAASDEVLLEQVKASGKAKIEVRRGNQTFTVNYPIR